MIAKPGKPLTIETVEASITITQHELSTRIQVESKSGKAIVKTHTLDAEDSSEHLDMTINRI